MKSFFIIFIIFEMTCLIWFIYLLITSFQIIKTRVNEENINTTITREKKNTKIG